MSFESERIAIEGRFKDNWDHLNVPIKFENVEYTPVSGKSFVELFVVDGTTEIVGISSTTMHRSVGIISIRINVPLGIGTRKGRELADTAADIFRGISFSGIICRAASITRMGEINGWYVHVVSIPFFRDEIF